jgi:hypothetical protein
MLTIREAKELIKHEIRVAGYKISKIDPSSIYKAAQILCNRENNSRLLDITPSGRVKYDLWEINRGATWDYLDINLHSLSNVVAKQNKEIGRLVFSFKRLSSTSARITRN